MNLFLARLAGALMLVGLLAAEPASAGTYHVYSCKTPTGMLAPADGWSEAPAIPNSTANTCAGASSSDPKLLTTVYGTLGAGQHSALVYDAAPDTTFRSLTIDRVFLRQGAPVSGAYLAGWIGIDVTDWSGQKDACGADCGGKGYAGTASPQPEVTLGPLSGVTRVAASAGCVGTSPCVQQGGTPAAASVEIARVDAELMDAQAPAVGDVAGALTAEGAHRGSETVSFTATDKGAGVYHTSLELRAAGSQSWEAVDRHVADPNDGRCVELDARTDTDREFAWLQPCALSVKDTATLDTKSRPDGQYVLRVRVEDAAGNVGEVLPERTITIDNRPPKATARPTVAGTSTVGQTLTSTQGTWNGAGLTFALQWMRCTGAEADVCTAIAGATTATYKLRTEDVGALVRLRVTATNPDGSDTAESDAFGPVTAPATATPTPVATPAHTVTPSPTAPGTAEAQEAGGNGVNASAKARLSLSGPNRLRLRYGRTGRTTLSLRDERGRAISGASVVVLQRLSVPGAGFAALQSPLITNEDGKVRLVIDSGPSRTLRFVYDPKLKQSSEIAHDLRVTVVSRTSFATDRSNLRNGQTVRFLGRVLSRPVPAGGVVIDLQARVGSRWQSFRSVRTAADGKWRSSYRFTSTRGVQTYTFRAVVRGDTGFPYRPSVSRHVKVTVRG